MNLVNAGYVKASIDLIWIFLKPVGDYPSSPTLHLSSRWRAV